MATLADEVAASYAGELDVVGMSLGGMVGQHLAVRHPDRVRSLVVGCTGAAANAEVMEERAVAAETGGMAAVLDSTLERWFTPAALAQRPEHPGVAYARRTLLGLDPGSFADGWRAIAGHDIRERLPEIRVPVTCVAGSADTASPVARTQEVAERVQNSRFVVLDGPHMMHLERPAEFSAVVRDHLRWVEEG
jgi:3-oxoadipate enol-lactonase